MNNRQKLQLFLAAIGVVLLIFWLTTVEGGTGRVLGMKIEEAIVLVLASSNHGMKTDQIAKEINEKGLFTRWDKQPVDGRMIYAVVMSHPETFVKSDGLIRLMI